MHATANITIQISPNEADIFLAIKESGALNISWGKVTLNFANGVLQNVVKEEMIYKR